MGLFDKFRSRRADVLKEASIAEEQALSLVNEGNVLEETGHLDLACRRYDAALQIAPGFARAHLNRGNALLAMGDIEGSIAAYGMALAINPKYAGAYFNLGNAHARLGRLNSALSSYASAAKFDGNFADAHVASGCLLEDLGRNEEAIASYQRALEIEPRYAQVHSNLGNALRSAGHFEEAARSHRRALELDSSLAQAHNNLGNVLKDLGRLDEAEASYRRTLAIEPNHTDAFSNLLFTHNYSGRHTASELLAEAKAFGEVVNRRARQYTTWNSTPHPGRRLRVGLVSGDLRDHPVGYFLESVIAALVAETADALQLIGYATVVGNDRLAEHFRDQFHEWHPVQGMPDEMLAKKIHDDAIDVLIDLSGHSAHNRLPVFAWKPSPIQISWLGYFGTTGVAEIDYLIADPWTLKEDQASAFTEKIWRLPETRLCFSAPSPTPEVGELPAASGTAFTFGCFNNLSKVNAEVIELWARVLNAVPGSRLLLKSPQLQQAVARDGIAARFSVYGIAPDRLTLEGLTPRFEYLAAYGRVDIALDPFPFTGGTTTAEALWMGVPVLTLAGDLFLSRQGLSLLSNLDMFDWIANDKDHYISLAVRHASDLTKLAALRTSLRQRLSISPLMDATRFARHFEIALREMWQRWCNLQVM